MTRLRIDFRALATPSLFTVLLLLIPLLFAPRSGSAADESLKQVDDVLTSEANSPLDMLQNVSDSELKVYYHNQPFDPTDPMLIKVLYRYPRMGRDNIERFGAEQKTSLAELAADPAAHQAQVFLIDGKVTDVAAEKLLPDVAENYDFTQYYRVTVQSDDVPNPLVVCVLEIPQAWSDGHFQDAPTRFYGLFLKPGDISETPSLVFAADRMGWYPDKVDKSLGISESQLYLSSLGMDYGLFEVVRSQNGMKLMANENETFYQMLAAISRAEQDELLDKAGRKLSLVPLMQQNPKVAALESQIKKLKQQEPSPPNLEETVADLESQVRQLLYSTSQQGKLMLVEGTARRVQKIPISQDYFGKRFGIDHYYEVDMVIPLEQPIVLTSKPGDKEGVTYQNEFPVVVCVLRLPEGLEEGTRLNEPVRIPCFYFKLWAYKSQFTREARADGRQLSPMLIGLEPELNEPELAANPYIPYIAIALVVLALGGVWLGLWRSSRGDNKFKREQLDKQFEVEKGKSLNKMGIEADDGPDFSNLK